MRNFKYIYIHITKKEYKIFPQVSTKEGYVGITYKPVYILPLNSDKEQLKNAIFNSFHNSLKIIDFGDDFPGNKAVYEKYLTDILLELKEKSFSSFQRKSKAFGVKLLDTENKVIILPYQYRSGGSIIIEDEVEEYNIEMKNEEEITGIIMTAINK